MKHSISNYAFTERGLYMLATILKGPIAVQTTLSIMEIELYSAARQADQAKKKHSTA